MSPITAIAPPTPHVTGLRLRLGKVCVAIQAATPAELIDHAEAALKDTRFVELRLDALPKPLLAIPYLKQFLSEHKDVSAIATCRRAALMLRKPAA